jgi:site-specific recombinase XerD
MVQRHGTRRQPQPPKLLEQARAVIRARHYSLRTKETYLGWMKNFILFHGKRHPRDMGTQEVQQFLSHLAVEGHVAASTQSQALSAIVFLYQQVLNQDIGGFDKVVRAKQPHRVPVVLTQDEVTAVLRHLSGTSWMMATLLYGAGLRLMECLRLRVKDVDFPSNQIVVRDGKGHQDRVTMLPQQVKAPIQRHLHDVQQLHGQDLQAGGGTSTCHMRWSANTPMPVMRGCGNMSSLLPNCRETRGRGSSGDITSTN